MRLEKTEGEESSSDLVQKDSERCQTGPDGQLAKEAVAAAKVSIEGEQEEVELVHGIRRKIDDRKVTIPPTRRGRCGERTKARIAKQGQ